MNSVLLEVLIDLASSFKEEHLEYLFSELNSIDLAHLKENNIVFINELVNLTVHKVIIIIFNFNNFSMGLSLLF